MLDVWDAAGRAAGWHLVPASDLGQITATAQVSLLSELCNAGFAAGKAIGPDADVAVKPGYAGGITVRDRNPVLAERIFRWLREQDWCGLVLRREAWPGILPMAAINVAHDRPPDLWVALRTGAGTNAWGYPGTPHFENPDIPPGGCIHDALHRS